MPDIRVDFRAKDYVTDQGITVRSLRPFITIQIGSLRPLCFLDTGAPFSIVSFTVAQQIKWKLLGSSLAFQGKSVPLDWQGIPCDFGETNVVILDPSGAISQAGRIAGKFAKARHPTLENYVLLGMNFLADNNFGLTMSGSAGSVTGVLSAP